MTIEAERSCPEGRDASIEQMDSYVDSARIGESTVVLHEVVDSRVTSCRVHL